MDHALNAHIKILDYSCSQVSRNLLCWSLIIVYCNPPHTHLFTHMHTHAHTHTHIHIHTHPHIHPHPSTHPSTRVQEREAQKLQWLQWCMEELRTNEKWVIPALKQMKEICMLYLEVKYAHSIVHILTAFCITTTYLRVSLVHNNNYDAGVYVASVASSLVHNTIMTLELTLRH